MTYPSEWKGKIKVSPEGIVFKRGLKLGSVVSSHVEGAKSPGGMVTNVVWRVLNFNGSVCAVFSSKTKAIESLVNGSVI
jgi:hypothetical protein